ncbi:hypothetical protein [Photobacterium piscicola]|uniref:hypothetical protein n=1 Tax=Photobacterium piscicola TaxID=1378299 RepID=UPI002E175F87|nr:hypothetical protein [Photobacterium piscicola]
MMNYEWLSCESSAMLTFFKQRLSIAQTNAEYDAIIAMIKLCHWEQKTDSQDEDEASNF